MTVHLIPSIIKHFRLVLVKANDKAAFEPGLPSYTWDDPKLQAHLKADGNYGVLAGDTHAIIDADDMDLIQLVRSKLPATFEVESPGHSGVHFYYTYSGQTKTIPIKDKSRPENEQNIGHVRIGNGYVVGPYSTHPNGKQYLVKEARPLATVTEQEIRGVLAPYIAERQREILRHEFAENGDLDFDIMQIVNVSLLRQHGSGWQGPHPAPGHCKPGSHCTVFSVDPGKNVWFCHRCLGGGGPLQLLGVIEGIIKCDDLLRGDDFKKTKAIALERGLIQKPKRDKKQDKKKQEKPRELPWKTVTQAIACIDEKTLYESILAWLKRYCDVRPEYYHVIAAWIIHTWIYDDFRATGPLLPIGPINSGKTTLLEILEETAYLGIRGGNMSNSTMFRLSHICGPSFLLDEAQVMNREEWAEQQAFINERYRKGGKVWRVENIDGETFVPTFFNCFGPTALAMSGPPWPALASRGLILHMEKNRKPVEQTLTPPFEEEGQKLRNALQGYRDKWKGHEKPEIPELASVKDYRTREVGYPLLVVTPTEYRTEIVRYLQSLEEEHQAEERTDDLADYVRALDILEPEKHTNGKATAFDIRDALATVLDMVELRLKKGTLDQETPERTISKDVPKERTILKALVTLGFKKKENIGPKSRNGIIWDKELLDRLKTRYGIGGASKE